MKENPFVAIIEQITTTMVEATAVEFKKWMAQSDAPASVKEQFLDATLDLTDRELGVIVLSSSNWFDEIKK